MEAEATFDILTRATVWLAMLGWTLGIVFGHDRNMGVVSWTGGLVFYVAHILLAYQFFYDWDHGVAWQVTAGDTEALTGFRSGVGLLVNFGFLLALFLDVIRQWCGKERVWSKAINSLVVFMIVNGAIVFGEGAVRWFGAILIVVIIVPWISRTVMEDRGSSDEPF